jgi:magnesium-transporting ATPase (P-type)
LLQLQHEGSNVAPSNLEIALLKTYPFDSAVQRMTVISKKKGANHYDVYVKGAPEKVAGLCKPETSKLKDQFLFKIYRF